jgi:[NiFe] hydrogenase assembly HybE family chaperone
MTADAEVADISFRLEAHFHDVHLRAMVDVPICNPALAVASVGFRPWRDQAFGIVLTPWFMNIVLAPLSGAPALNAASGETRSIALPCGKVDFLVAELDGFGRLLMCSLFSPMDDFVDQEAALATAQAAIDGLSDAGLLAEAPEPEIYPFAPDTPRETPAERAEKFRLRETAEAPQLDRRSFFLRGADRKAPTP